MPNHALKQWAREARNSLAPEIRTLIAQAKFDLHFGPNGEGLDDTNDNGEPVYPGFDVACKRIAEAVDVVTPSALYIDEQDCCSTEEPSADRCEACEGSGEDEGGDPCETCLGHGYFEPVPYVEVGPTLIKVALLGELAEYVP